MLSYLTLGTILGLSAGFAPGPLLALVVVETLQHGMKAGIKVAIAPVLTDIPIIAMALFLLAKVSRFNNILGSIAITGAIFILYMGIENLRTRGLDIQEKLSRPKSLQRGIIVNALSPYPYLFWISVGGPTTMSAMERGLPAAISFISSFYVLLLGSKIVLALMVGKSRSFLLGNRYIYAMRMLGFVLLVFAGILFRDGLRLLGLF